MALIPRTTWKIKYADSTQARIEGHIATYPEIYGLIPESVYDNNINTYWHTQWDPVVVSYPHEIQIDMGAIYSVNGFQYQACLTNCDFDGWIIDYEIYISLNGFEWTLVKSGKFEATATLKEVTFTATNGRYIRFRGLNADSKGQQYMAAAEINALGTLTLSPKFKVGDYVKNTSLGIECTTITNVTYTTVYNYVMQSGTVVAISTFDGSGLICTPAAPKFSIGNYVKSDTLEITCKKISDIKYTDTYYYVFEDASTISVPLFDVSGVTCSPCSDLATDFKITIV